MASLRSLTILRRSLVARSFHSTALRKGGRPPLPPYKRSPAKWETLTENYDSVWDDGVAPELFLDFDAPNVSSREALGTLVGVLFSIWVIAKAVSVSSLIPENPALPHEVDVLAIDWASVPGKASK